MLSLRKSLKTLYAFEISMYIYFGEENLVVKCVNDKPFSIVNYSYLTRPLGYTAGFFCRTALKDFILKGEYENTAVLSQIMYVERKYKERNYCNWGPKECCREPQIMLAVSHFH